MRKTMVRLMLGLALLGTTPSMAVNPERGGVMGFIAGCCFGVRAGAAYNDGKEIHWREWVMLIPYVNFVFAIWNGVDGANGVTSKDHAEKYGAMYY